MPKEWKFETRVAAPPAAVYAWLSDYQNDDHTHEAFRRGSKAKKDGKHQRRVVERKDARSLVVRDEWGSQTYTMHVELAPEAHEVRLRGQMGYSGLWKVEPDGAGSIVTSTSFVAPRGFAKIFAPLFAGMFMKQMRADFDGHVEHMKSDLEKR